MKPDIENLTPNLLLVYFLMSSYLYYRRDLSVLTDSEYDAICLRLAMEWDNVTHRHKCLVSLHELESGTGYYIPERLYPTIVKASAMEWYYSSQNLSLETLLS